MHELADLPHEGLVAVDQGLCLVAVIVKTRGRHGRLDLLHRLFALGNPGFEVGDLGLPALDVLIALALLGLIPFSGLVGL